MNCSLKYSLGENKVLLKEILELMKKTYPQNNYVLCIYDDESGRIIYPEFGKSIYDVMPILEFDSIDDLARKLIQEK